MQVHVSCLTKTDVHFLKFCVLSMPPDTITERNKLKPRYREDSEVIMGAMTSQITSLMIVFSTVYSGADQRKHQSSASLAFMPEIHRWPVNFPHKWPVKLKIFTFDDVIMERTVFSQMITTDTQLPVYESQVHVCVYFSSKSDLWSKL